MYKSAVSVDRTRDRQIFSLTLSQLSYPGIITVSLLSRLGFEPRMPRSQRGVLTTILTELSMRVTRIELATFGTGIRCATIAPYPQMA